MNSTRKPTKLKARLPRGLSDRGPAEIAATRRMIDKIREVYERYGFEPVETPAFEYTDALGKFLPDQDRPNEGVFSFQDDDEQWLSLRYDLTAPLARYVAENFQHIALPYRSYRYGWVFRNEKPGPGRFRQFMQFDADTVGSASPAADAEMCMMAADTMEALGIPRGSYVVRVNNRKVLDGVLESIGLGGEENAGRRLTVLRALDKYDRLGSEGVIALLGPGRNDESGDFTKGAGLTDKQIAPLLRFLEFGRIYTAIQHGDYEEVDTHFPNPFFYPPATWDCGSYVDSDRMMKKAAELHRKYDWSFNLDILGEVALLFDMNETLARGLSELAEIESVLQSTEFVDVVRLQNPSAPSSRPDHARILIDPSVVRGLEYYTGPVYELELLLDTIDEDGKPVRFGSVGGGGRYDGLVARFRREPVPATGFSIGVSRLLAALQHLKKIETKPAPGPVVVVPRTKQLVPHCMRLVQQLREAKLLTAIPGFAAELYLGGGSFKGGLSYANRRNCDVAIMIGESEADTQRVIIKDLHRGAELAKFETERSAHLQRQAEAQRLIREDELADEVRALLTRRQLR